MMGSGAKAMTAFYDGRSSGLSKGREEGYKKGYSEGFADGENSQWQEDKRIIEQKNRTIADWQKCHSDFRATVQKQYDDLLLKNNNHVAKLRRYDSIIDSREAQIATQQKDIAALKAAATENHRVIEQLKAALAASQKESSGFKAAWVESQKESAGLKTALAESNRLCEAHKGAAAERGAQCEKFKQVIETMSGTRMILATTISRLPADALDACALLAKTFNVTLQLKPEITQMPFPVVDFEEVGASVLPAARALEAAADMGVGL